jgi:hypothetical protein
MHAERKDKQNELEYRFDQVGLLQTNSPQAENSG